MKTIQEHLAALKDAREEKHAELKKISEKAMEENRTMDGAEAEAFEKLRAEIKKIDAEVERLGVLESMDAKTAKPVTNDVSAEKTMATAVAAVHAQPKEKLEPGIGFARAARCLALGFMEHRNPVEIAAERYGDSNPITKTTRILTTKAAVPAASTTDPEWAGALVHDRNVAGFLEYLRPRTLVGQFGQNGIPALRQVPFRAPLIVQTQKADAQWSGEGKQKIVVKAGWSEVKLEPRKIAAITVATMELVRDSDPSVDALLRDELARSVIERMDISFLRPDLTPETYRPGSILNGITETPASGGTDADAVRSDIGLIVNKFLAANNQLSGAVLLMGSKLAYALAMMFTLGNREFPNIEISGGKLAGIPTIVSDYVPDGIVALVSAPDILYADDGGVELAMSTEASLKMVSIPGEAAEMVSMWQNNLVAFRAEKRVSWMRSPRQCVEYLTGVAWGQA